ncbi:putative secreted protein [Parapusillimonas granuli]|nr:putative secreted protein [Parapusillimonas granuli]
MGAQAFHRNPYDGHTLRVQMEQATILIMIAKKGVGFLWRIFLRLKKEPITGWSWQTMTRWRLRRGLNRRRGEWLAPAWAA